MTLDIVTAAYAAVAAAGTVDAAATDDDAADASQAEDILIRVFSMKSVTFLSHTLPPPSHSTLVAALKTCMRLNCCHLATKLMMITCQAEHASACLVSTRACKAISEGLRRGVAAKRYGAAVVFQCVKCELL
jgi:hypothetical protein